MLVSLTAIRDQRFDNAPRFDAWYLTFYLFETLDDYRQWCEENLPDWLGYDRV